MHFKFKIKMNIVILTTILPYPLTSGGAQAQYNMINTLREKHNISLVFPERSTNSISAMETLQKIWPNVTFYPYRYWLQLLDFRFLFSKIKRAFDLLFNSKNDRFKVERILKPYGMPSDKRFNKFLDKVIVKEKADVVQIEFYQFLHHVHMLPPNVKKIFIHHELRYVRNQRLLDGIDLLVSEKLMYDSIKKREIDDLNCFDKVVTLTKVDSDELISSGVTVPVYVSPAAVNTLQKSYASWNGNIVFLGGYGHIPNQEGLNWFLKNVADKIDWTKYPNTYIDIIGKGWDKRNLNYDETRIKLRCHGFVEDLSQILCGSIMIVPILSGSGMRMKILEASALGVPFITTTVGVEGLDFENNESCLIEDNPESWVKALEHLMTSETLRARLATCASNIYESKYSVSALSKVREEVYLK